MSFKSFIRDIQEFKGGIGSISKRGFEMRSAHCRSRSQVFTAVAPAEAAEQKCDAAPTAEQQEQQQQQQQDQQLQSCWANMPPELLRDIIQRLESSESTWPQRRHVVACAAVCCTWRDITKELVKAPEFSERITFPSSLKQPGPRETPLQCYIKRDRTTATYRLYLGLSPTLMENGKFLLAARKFRRATSTDYIISIDPDDISRGSNNCVGKLRSNFLGTKFAIYDTQSPHGGAVASTNKAGRRVCAKQVSPRVPAGSYNVAHISYELNVLGTRGPRRMQCTLHTATASCSEQNVTQLSGQMEEIPSSKGTSGTVATEEAAVDYTKGDPLVLKNKSPRWHEQLQCWCLNFRGRVTVASVKNFQLVAAASGGSGDQQQQQQPPSHGEQDKVLLQFGKIGKDMFTMDYRYPLSAFQAFAICLSSFDTKLACE